MVCSVACILGDTCKLKTALPDNVIFCGPFRYIKASTAELIPYEQLPQIVQATKTGMRHRNFLGLSTRETKREHLASLAERHASTTICPKCGKALVLRTVKRGEKAGQQFYGGSGFPG